MTQTDTCIGDRYWRLGWRSAAALVLAVAIGCSPQDTTPTDTPPKTEASATASETPPPSTADAAPADSNVAQRQQTKSEVTKVTDKNVDELSDDDREKIRDMIVKLAEANPKPAPQKAKAKPVAQTPEQPGKQGRVGSTEPVRITEIPELTPAKPKSGATRAAARDVTTATRKTRPQPQQTAQKPESKSGCGSKSTPGALTPPPLGQPQPKLVCAQTKVEKNNVWKGQKTTFAFKISNTGSGPLKIHLKGG